MEKQEYSQLELFHKAGDEGLSAQRLSGTFLSYIRTYERLVLMLIGIVITGVVCFCIGVEKGKLIAMSRINSNLDMAYRAPAVAVQALPASAAPVKIVPQAVRQPVPVAVPVRVNQPVTVAKVVLPAGSGFTIQIGSYAGKTSAQQEIEILKKQGLLPMLKSSGKYTVLCVGKFPDQATAKSLLTQLKRKYRDCYIRRL